ncbi:hypothetical protein L6R53_12600 [Myxococcota bacterium]|nr:hypothetical protein [Myxococcota bacterium]
MDRTLAILLLALVACGDKEEEDDTGAGGSGDGGSADGGTGDGGAGDGGAAGDLAALLTETGGCGDVFLWAASADQAWALTFRLDAEMAERAHAAGGPLTSSWDMALDYGLAPSLSVQRGSDLRRAFCNDVSEPYEIDQEWWIAAGEVTLTLTPDGEPTDWGEYPCDAVLTIEGASFTAEGVDPVALPGFELRAAVGWMPG